MKLTEFDQWYEDLCAVCPDIRAWISGQPDNGKSTISAWFKALEEVQLRHAMDVNAGLITGRLLPLQRSDYPGIPALVRHHAYAMGRRENPARYDRATPEEKPQDDEPHLGELLRKADAVMRSQGREAAHRLIDEAFGQGQKLIQFEEGEQD